MSNCRKILNDIVEFMSVSQSYWLDETDSEEEEETIQRLNRVNLNQFHTKFIRSLSKLIKHHDHTMTQKNDS